MSFFNVNKRKQQAAAQVVDPGPAPAPAEMPTQADPAIRQAEIEAERAAGKRKGRASTKLNPIVSGQLGDDLGLAPVPKPPKTPTTIGGGGVY